MEDKREFLETKARQARELALTVIASFGNGHVGGSMTIMDALAVLFYDAMRLDDQDPDWPHQKLDNLTVLLDYNKGQVDGFVADIEAVAPHEPKWEAFGWDVQRVDGYDVLAAAAAIEKAKTVSGKPQLIVLIRSRARALCRLKESPLPTPYGKASFHAEDAQDLPRHRRSLHSSSHPYPRQQPAPAAAPQRRYTDDHSHRPSGRDHGRRERQSYGGRNSGHGQACFLPHSPNDHGRTGVRSVLPLGGLNPCPPGGEIPGGHFEDRRIPYEKNNI